MLTATSKLKTNPNNPRSIRKDQLQKLVKSLREFPEMLEARPIVVDPDFVVLGGNMRLKAAQEAGLKEVPVYIASWEEAKHKEFIIKDNGHSGEWDQDMLANDGWDTEELKEWGVPIDWDPVQETEGLTDPDDVPAVPEEPTTKLGDLWILGDHRLLCGDSTKAEDVERLMNGATADALVTDPPYGIKYSGKGQKGKAKANNFGQILGDGSTTAAKDVFTATRKTKYPFECWWGANYYCDILEGERSWIVWNKEVVGENYSAAELAWTNQEGRTRMFTHQWHGMIKASEQGQARMHPTQKPVELFVWLVNEFKLSFLYDPFLGSGSTLIAAEKAGRKCYGMELDPKYCDVIVKRWENFTGKKAELWKQ
jgi:hypothetical protein